ncbi:PAAR domain-containing protein [Gallibacterium anatis]|uniref:PAAR domain-containing protein n=1 Tax=Gallibacterium anatis TaxID=750 RepID=A0AAX3XIC1_9PAST|nr:PAAR domain-containing protein [Gallibacterium anatis]MDK9431098.1 PAAR domain-containing protein [Gallibacterium anatis]WIM80700.1 PAAR domain-containing protein [Gallibacterium anatis]
MDNTPDIVQRITQHIQSFQRSKVQLGEPREVVMPAARVGDIINHTSFWSALAGAVVGACVTAGIFALASAAVAAVGITGGLAAPIAAAVLGGVATWAVSDGIEKVTNAVTNFINEAIGGDPSGPIILGSPNVLVNNKPLALAKLPLSVGCTRHSPVPQIAQASETVSANGKPVARKGDKTECSATIAEGSPNVFFGSGQGTYVDMKPEFTGFQRALLFAVEFVVPPTALFGKGIGKAFTQTGRTLATRGAHVGAAIASRAKNLFNKSVFKFRQKFAKTAEEAADNALQMGKQSGAAAELRVGNKTYTDISGNTRRPLHEKLQKALENVPMEHRPKWHSHCAEIACIDKALKNGHTVNGAEMRAVNIGSSGKGHRTPKKPCITCSKVAKELGINIK